MGYDVQQVCLSGHQITARANELPQHLRDHCPKCGSKTITACGNCKTPIPGHYSVDGFFSSRKTLVPPHCGKCGKPFPWTTAKALLATPAPPANQPDSLALVLQICSRFHLVARQLNYRHADRQTLEINDEYDVQDLMHALLHIGFDDVRNEEWTPSYAGGASRVDFLLASEKIVVEIKKTRTGLKAKEIGEQLLIDIARYQKHPDCKTLVCFVYDPEARLANPRGLENDLRRGGDFTVCVLVVPKGY